MSEWSPRELTLVHGLIDRVKLGRVNWHVAQQDESMPAAEIQTKTLETIRSLVSEGLFELGDLHGRRDTRFVKWDRPLDESMERIRDVYVGQYDDNIAWTDFCWLRLTDKGEQVARPLQQRYIEVEFPGETKESLREWRVP